jgi:hypothetical protein
VKTTRADSYGMVNVSQDHLVLAVSSSSLRSYFRRSCDNTILIVSDAWKRPGLRCENLVNNSQTAVDFHLLPCERSVAPDRKRLGDFRELALLPAGNWQKPRRRKGIRFGIGLWVVHEIVCRYANRCASGDRYGAVRERVRL